MSQRLSVHPEFTTIPAHAWIGRAGNAALAAIFIVLIAIPPIGFWVGPRHPQASPENRTFARAPEFAMDPPERLPSEIDAYFGDYFGLRSALVHWDSVLRYRWLGVSSKRLVVGPGHWAFFAGDGMFENHMGLAPFQASELEAWRAYLEQRQAVAAATGARYVFVVAPDKVSVYPEMLPSSMRVEAGRSRLDQLIAYLRTCGSKAWILDLRDPLRAAKNHGLIYFPQDTHWNGRGYFAAYLAICNALQPFFPSIHLQNLSRNYQIVRTTWGVGNWSQVGLPEENLRSPSDFLFPLEPKAAHRAPLDAIAELVAIKDPEHMPVKLIDEQAPYSIVVFHDSFFYTGISDRLKTPFGETFGKSIYVGVYPTDKQFQALVTHEQPTIVLEERVERFISGSPAR